MAHHSSAILGVSLGTRRLGTAIGTFNGLMDWQMRVFKETYSRKKAKKIWRAIERIIDRYGITAIGMKLPPHYSHSYGMKQCLEYITEKVLEKNISLFFYNLQTIENHYLISGTKNKVALAAALAEKYPELKREFFKLSKSPYYLKLFEAVGAMDIALSELL